MLGGPGNPFQVFGSHMYANPGNYLIGVLVEDGGVSSVSTTVASIAAPPPLPWTLSAGERRNDVERGTLVGHLSCE